MKFKALLRAWEECGGGGALAPSHSMPYHISSSSPIISWSSYMSRAISKGGGGQVAWLKPLYEVASITCKVCNWQGSNKRPELFFTGKQKAVPGPCMKAWCHNESSWWWLEMMTKNFFSVEVLCASGQDQTPSVQDQLWAWWATMFVGITHLLPRLLSSQTPRLSLQSSHTLPCSGAALLHQGSSGMWPWS